MCGNMVDIESATAENRRRKKNKKERRNHRGKIECPHLLHTAAIIINLKKTVAYSRVCWLESARQTGGGRSSVIIVNNGRRRFYGTKPTVRLMPTTYK